MLHFFIPYDTNKKLLVNIDHHICNLPTPKHWAALMDGDAMFTFPDFGHSIIQYIKKYPKTGMFTCYASRCHYSWQRIEGADPENPSIMYHARIAEQQKLLPVEVQEINTRIAGHLMVIKKETWLKVRQQVFQMAAQKNILGVDTQISKALLKNGYKIHLMKTIYMIHYLRMLTGQNKLIS